MRTRVAALVFAVCTTTAAHAAQTPVPPVATTPPSAQSAPPPPPAQGTPLPGQRPPTLPPPKTAPQTLPQPSLPPPRQQPPSSSKPDVSRQNVKIDVTFSDTGAEGQTKKTLTLLLLNHNNGQIRSTGREGGIINIDALPRLYDNGIAVSLTIEYLPELTPQQIQSGVRFGMLSQSLTVLLESGKPTVVTQSADPRTDRRVTVEVTATILR